MNFLIVWSEGFDRLLQAMVVGPRGNVLVPPHRLSTGMAHARPALAWTGESYLLVSIDMQVPRRLLVHQITTRGQLAGTPPVVIAQEARSSAFPADSVVLMAASPRAIFVWFDSISPGPPGASMTGLGTGLTRLDRSGSVLETTQISLGGMRSIAVDGSNVFFGQQRSGGCQHPCVYAGGALVKVPVSSNEWSATAYGISETSLASSPAGVFYIDRQLGRRPQLVRGDVHLTGPAVFPSAEHHTTWVGSKFLVVWREQVSDNTPDMRVTGAYVTPSDDAPLSVSEPFTIAPHPSSQIMAIAGNNRDTALILGRNPDGSLEWMTVSQTPRRIRAIRR
ncbi:MAG: hypothetical protein ACYC7A_08035 [Thermoanaerobaculia bacterium]